MLQWQADSGRKGKTAIPMRWSFKLQEKVGGGERGKGMAAIDAFMELMQPLRGWHVGYR